MPKECKKCFVVGCLSNVNPLGPGAVWGVCVDHASQWVDRRSSGANWCDFLAEMAELERNTDARVEIIYRYAKLRQGRADSGSPSERKT